MRNNFPKNKYLKSRKYSKNNKGIIFVLKITEYKTQESGDGENE